MQTAIDNVPAITRVVETVKGQQTALDPLAEGLQSWLRDFVARSGEPMYRIKDVLHGVWLGHPLHPALTDVPIGAWWAGMLFDLVGARRAADASIGVGVLAAVPTAAAGLADWSETEAEPRRVGLVHGLLNSLALGCFVGSLAARRSGHRALGVGLSTSGLALTIYSAWLGGELVYVQGTGVNRRAWEPEVQDWHVAAKARDLVEGKLVRGEITQNGTRIPLVLLRRGDEILALAGECAHWGGPLAEGTLVGDTCVQCPWHGSQFSLRDGHVVRGPAASPQPVYEARVHNNASVQVRRVRQPSPTG